jgi:pantoate--beta-alanine ligase
MVRIVQTTADLREAVRGYGLAPGFVPTLGALHEGHAALIHRSAGENPATVVSVFVNPTQFDDPEDLARYPSSLDRDVALAGEAGADLVFAPAPIEIYPPGFATSVEVAGLTDRWEGAIRPGHFQAVATVVTILINLVRPGRSYFGEKDFQQLLVVRRLHRDLALPGAIVACPTVRDGDGLALSSRNARLSGDERRQAATVPRALVHMADLAAGGERSIRRLIAAGRDVLAESPDLTLDYLAIVDPETLEPLDELNGEARALIAVRLGDVRLIDNIAIGPPDEFGREANNGRLESRR